LWCRHLACIEQAGNLHHKGGGQPSNAHQPSSLHARHQSPHNPPECYRVSGERNTTRANPGRPVNSASDDLAVSLLTNLVVIDGVRHVDISLNGKYVCVQCNSSRLPLITEMEEKGAAKRADKPNSVRPRVICIARDRAIIHLGRSLPAGSCTLPAAGLALSQGWEFASVDGPPAAAAWACWRWGLPCRDGHPPRGALLPHHFTLTTRRWRYLFCGTVPRLAPGWRYQPPCPAQFGLSSRRSADARKHPPAGARSPPPASPPPAIIPDCDPAYEPAHSRRMRVRARMSAPAPIGESKDWASAGRSHHQTLHGSSRDFHNRRMPHTRSNPSCIWSPNNN
jgi:hypothetical protein